MVDSKVEHEAAVCSFSKRVSFILHCIRTGASRGQGKWSFASICETTSECCVQFWAPQNKKYVDMLE